MERLRQNQKGVTLMEMMIVVAIIGIMAGVSLPNLTVFIKNTRVRVVTLELLATIRKTRQRAISMGRDIEIRIDIDKTEPADEKRTYDMTKLLYVLYNPLSADQRNPIVLNREDSKILYSGVDFDPKDRLAEVVVAPETVEDDTHTLALTFNASGLARITGAAIASVQLKGEYIAYEIKVYKAGQISLSKLNL